MGDTRKGRERFTALRLGADGYETTDRVDADDPLAISAPLASLFELPG